MGDGERRQTGPSSDDEAQGNPGDDTPAPVGANLPTKEERDANRDEIARLFELVPQAGTSWRWYDVPYRVLDWTLSGWRRRVIPWRVRQRLNNALNWFGIFDQYERLKIDRRRGSFHSLVVPEDEAVRQGGIWVVDFFPPSYYDDLLRSLNKNGWGDSKFFGSIDGSNAEQVMRARRGSGFLWSRLGTVENPNSKYMVFDAKREVLPREFDLVELTGVQIGTSLTAVVAFMRLSQEGQHALNEVWKAEHEPTFEWRGLRRPQIDGRHSSAMRATQRERQRLHDTARTWLAERCGGFFARTEARQPVVDFNTFEKFDPTTEAATKEMGEPLRALGMQSHTFNNYVSPQIPGAALVPGASFPRLTDPLQNCWGIVSSYEVFSQENETSGYGDKPYAVATLAAMVNEAARSFLLHDAVVQYARQLTEQAASQRDSARVRHRDFSPRQLDSLKQDLLTTSLDLPAVARDSALLWSPRWRQLEGVEVQAVTAPGRPNPSKEFDVIEELGKSREELFAKLLEDDSAYRGVLATTSSLGASAASVRLGRRALMVSCASLLVSATTLIAVNGDAVWTRLADWLPGL